MKIEAKDGFVYINGEIELDATLIGFHLMDLAEKLKDATIHEELS